MRRLYSLTFRERLFWETELPVLSILGNSAHKKSRDISPALLMRAFARQGLEAAASTFAEAAAFAAGAGVAAATLTAFAFAATLTAAGH